MTTVEVLKAAKAKISDPARWTKGGMARSAKGRIVLMRSVRAEQWCAIGAVTSITGDGWTAGDDDWFCLTLAAQQMGHDGVAALNDGTDHATVMAMFDRAIAVAEAAEGIVR